MMRCVIMGLTSLIVAVLVPMWLLPKVEAEPVRAEVLVIENGPVQQEQSQTLKLNTGQAIQEIEITEYLTGVVLAEMPASFELEALKAQAVAARTFTMKKISQSKHEGFDLCSNSGCCQAWIDQASVAVKLGDVWNDYWEKAARAVEETDGQVIFYEGELIDAVYFSCSGGITEDAAAVWGSSVPYLQPVISPGEEDATRYMSEVRVSVEEFCRLLHQENSSVDLDGSAVSWFGDRIMSAGAGVYSMEIGGQVFTGTELRRIFGLNSTRFSVAVEKNTIVFEVQGFGHRVGMSQYGANAMAKSGRNWEEILKHYYTGIEIETIK